MPAKHLTRGPAGLSLAVVLSAVSIGQVCAAPTTGDEPTHAVTGASAAMTGTRHGGQFPTGMMTQFIDQLGLSGQQQTDIQIIMSDYGERFRDLAKIGRDTASELMALAPDDPAYRDKTDEASAIAATSAAEMVVLMAEMRSKLHMVLTETQRQQLRQMIADKRQKLKENKRPADSHHRQRGATIG